MCTTGCCGNGCRSPYVLPQGPQGPAGTSGPQGPTGADGAKGDTGSDGTPGSNAQQAVIKFTKTFGISTFNPVSGIGSHTLTAAELSVAGLPLSEVNVDTTSMTQSSVSATVPSYMISLYKQTGASTWRLVDIISDVSSDTQIREGGALVAIASSGDIQISVLTGTYKIIVIG